jgi:hypothetical protein
LNTINLEQYNTFNLITPRTIVHLLYQGEVLPTTQVYRQFREETTGLVWKINPIHFYGMDIGIGSAYSWSLQWTEKAEA